MLLQLDPRYPMVWRSERSAQFGADHAVAVVDDVGYAEELMLDALRVGSLSATVRLIGARAGADPDEIERFLLDVQPALRALRSRRIVSIAVDGSGPTASTLRSILTAEGCRLVGDPHPTPPDAAVLVTSYAVAPARAARWLRADVPHLAVVFGDQGVRMGPFVEPGSGPCLHCVDRHRTDAEPAWPRIVVQLMGCAAPTETVLASTFTAAIAADLVLRRVHGSEQMLSGRVRLHSDASGSFSEEELPPHPACGCRSLAGTGRAHDATIGRSPTATTRAAVGAGRG